MIENFTTNRNLEPKFQWLLTHRISKKCVKRKQQQQKQQRQHKGQNNETILGVEMRRMREEEKDGGFNNR